MVVNGAMLASELRRRRVAPRSLADSVQDVARSTRLLGDLRSTPTDLLVLAALNLAPDPVVEGRAARPALLPPD
jgi:hypothetical protein